jgi:non-specific serine/threonine protein kinase
MSLDAIESAGVTYRFGEFEFDVRAYELRCNGQPVRLARQPMDLLLMLVESRRELVTRQEIARRLWDPAVHTDVEAGIHTAVLKIRRALSDSSETPRFVATVPGKGYRFIARVDVVDRTSDSTELSTDASMPTRRHNLPAELTSFVGRGRELAELPRILTTSRLLCLTGAGGIGKTRLAVQLARNLLDRFAHGVWLVDLGPLTVPDLLPQAIATTFGIRDSRVRSVGEALIDMLRDRQLLLVLDTCEHLVEVCAAFVERLLHEAPALRVVATSREVLAVPGETVFRVSPLSLPDATISRDGGALIESEATQLFADRATSIDPEFRANDDTHGTVARICRRLDGIPLAIELAAAMLAVLSLEQIEERLQDGFRLLPHRARTAVARQRTLEATVEWSYQLLSSREQVLFRRLAVFPASWTLEAAERIGAGDGIDREEVLDIVARLAAKSLLLLESVPAVERRYRFLETVRHYARDRLDQAGETEELRRRHFSYFWTEFRSAHTTLRGRGQLQCLKRLDREQHNVRAALEYAFSPSGLPAEGVELASALFWYWTKRGMFEEGRVWLERATAVDARRDLRARASIGLAHMDYFQVRHAAVIAHTALALSDGRDAGDPWAVSAALFLQALTAFELGDYDVAQARAEEACEVAARGCEIIEQGGPLMVMASVALARGNQDRAADLFNASIDVHRQGGDTWGIGTLLSVTTGFHIARGDLATAHAHASEALSLYQQLEDPHGVAWCLDVFAGLMAARGFEREAALLWGASDGLMQTVAGSVPPTLRWIRDRYIEPVKASLGGAAFESLYAEGCAMPPTRAISQLNVLGAPANSDAESPSDSAETLSIPKPS